MLLGNEYDRHYYSVLRHRVANSVRWLIGEKKVTE